MSRFKLVAAHRIRITVLAAAVIILAIVGVLIAKTVTRPMDVKLRTYIKICSTSKSGKWNVIDEVGPANVKFRANLLEMASGRKIGTSFVWKTKTKKGFPYRVRLVEQAKTDINAVTGRFGVNLIFEITYKGMTARVPGTLTTEPLAGPLGSIRGRRVKGILGRNRTTMKLVSVNKFQPSPKSKPLMLVCTEEYQLSPKK